MNSLDELIKNAVGRDKLANLSNDTAIEEALAALYLCLSPKKLGELRANGGGPVFIKPQDPNAAGRNQPVSYVMGELRKWRASMSASSNLEVAKRQGLVSWVSLTEPFWVDQSGAVIGPAINQEDERWPDLFLQAITSSIKIEWMTPSDALRHRWASLESHVELAREYKAALEEEGFAVFAAVEATDLSIANAEIKPVKASFDLAAESSRE